MTTDIVQQIRKATLHRFTRGEDPNRIGGAPRGDSDL